MVKSEKYFMGIDFGTQSVKVAVYTIKGKKIAIATKKFDTQYLSEGHVEQDPKQWWEKLKIAFKELEKKIDTSLIQSLAVCATSSTVLLVDSDMNPITDAIMWMDNRNITEEKCINNTKNIQKNLKYSGGKVSTEWMVSKSLWFKNNYDLSNKRIIEQLDWINYKLTGKLVGSKCNATCKWNYVGCEGGFSAEGFKDIGLERIYEHWPKKILKIGDKIGKLSKFASNELGLNEDITVFQGGIDAHVGMIGANSLDFHNLCLITGTSFVHLINHEQPVFTEEIWGPYDSPLIDNYWLIEGGQLSAGSIITWYLQQFFEDHDFDEGFYGNLENEINAIKIGSDNLISLDHWLGSRTPYRNPNLKGAIIGLTPAHNKYHIYRAILESIAFGTKNVIDSIKKLSVPINRIVLGGGLSKNNTLMQMISDCTNYPLYLPDDEEISVKGAAIIACHGMGNYNDLITASNSMVKLNLSYEPNKKRYEKYKFAFGKYKQLNEILNPFINELSNNN